jgi:hypothetical protein
MDYRSLSVGIGLAALTVAVAGAAGLLARRRAAADRSMDMGALALAARHASRERAVWGTIAFVAAAGALDMVTTHEPEEVGVA